MKRQKTEDRGQRTEGSRQLAAGRNKNLGFRISRDAGGFTLIEVILIIVMVSIFMAAIGLPLLTAVRESDLPEIATTAYFLATERLEELAAVTTGSITSDGAPLAVSGFTGYSRQVTVEGVKCDDPTITDPEDDSGCRKVTVTVYHDRLPANGVSVVALRTAY